MVQEPCACLSGPMQSTLQLLINRGRLWTSEMMAVATALFFRANSLDLRAI